MAIRGNSITVSYTAWNTSTNGPQTLDAANHTIKLIKDGVEATATNAPAEVDATGAKGEYKLVLTATEMTCDFMVVCGVSSTANVVIIPVKISTEHGVLPNVQQGNAGCVPTVGTGTYQIATDGGGNVKSLLQGILSTPLTETSAGYLAAAFKKFFNLATPTSTMNEITLVDSTTNLTNAGPDTSGTTTLLGRLTSARAGYLDNLNVGGAVASHADIAAINQSASKHLLLVTVGQYEPGETYTVECRTFSAADGSAINADTTPTLTATGQVSGSLSANLSAATNPATGLYRWTYTPGSSPTLEQIRLDVSATISSATFTLSAYAQTVDLATAVFTSTDQSHLTAIYNKLPTNNLADETLLLAAIGTPAQASTALSTAQWTNALATALNTLAAHDPGGTLASHADIVGLGSPMQAGNVTVGGYAAGQDPATSVLAAAPSNAPTAGTVAWLLRLLDADSYTTASGNPWTISYMVRGTGAPGIGTLLTSKGVYDTAGTAITSTSVVVGGFH